MHFLSAGVGEQLWKTLFLPHFHLMAGFRDKHSQLHEPSDRLPFAITLFLICRNLECLHMAPFARSVPFITSLLALCWSAHTSPMGFLPGYKAGSHIPTACSCGGVPKAVWLRSGHPALSRYLSAMWTLVAAQTLQHSDSLAAELLPFSTPLLAGYKRLLVIIFALNLSMCEMFCSA